jgi:hypothetical protein
MSDEPDRPRTSRIGGFARRIAVDVTPLRASRDFRRLWLGLLASTFGSQFTIVATFLQVYSLTRSTVAVGLIGLVGFLALVAGPCGGTFLDVSTPEDLITAQVGYLASSGLLFVGKVRRPAARPYLCSGCRDRGDERDRQPDAQRDPRLLDRGLLPAAAA